MSSPGSSAPHRPDEDAPRVARSVELAADTDEVWRHLVEPDELEAWLGERVELDMQPGGCGHVVDDEGVRRDVLVTAVEPGRRLAWHWWEDGGELSSVEITLVPLDGRTRLDVVEVAAATVAPRASAATRRWVPSPTGSVLARVGMLALYLGGAALAGVGA